MQAFFKKFLNKLILYFPGIDHIFSMILYVVATYCQNRRTTVLQFIYLFSRLLTIGHGSNFHITSEVSYFPEENLMQIMS